MEYTTFERAYIECALWSSTNDDGEPLDNDFDIDDLDESAIKQFKDDCKDFYDANGIDAMTEKQKERAGYDFWLTRNRHGAGFWDGDWEKELGKKLTNAAHIYGSCDLYVGDNQKVCCL